jgi:hypothetical protein
MANLDPRIELIREKYGLDKADFWELPQKKGTWLVKHAALELAAAQANIRFDMPTIIEAHSADGIAAVAVQGQMGERFEWSIGECSPKNNKNSYPWAMAEKRAKDRVILKLIGIHGLVYSEDEMSDADALPTTKVKAQREIWDSLTKEIDACQTLDDLKVLWVSKLFQAEMGKLQLGWQKHLEAYKDSAKGVLTGSPASTASIAPNFDGLGAPQ